jgi:hypothetical protein
MAKLAVQFRYLTILKRQIFANARLSGSWDRASPSRYLQKAVLKRVIGTLKDQESRPRARAAI